MRVLCLETLWPLAYMVCSACVWYYAKGGMHAFPCNRSYWELWEWGSSIAGSYLVRHTLSFLSACQEGL